MTPVNAVEVRFDKYCKLCKHQEAKEEDYPCRYCLGQPWNEGSEKPIEFEAKEKEK